MFVTGFVVVAGILHLWGLLARQAATAHLSGGVDPWSVNARPAQQRAGFAAGLAMLAAFLVAAVELGGRSFAAASHNALSAILASLVAILLVSFAMTAQGWRWRTATLAMLAICAGLVAAIFAADGGRGFESQWWSVLVRLGAAFMAAELLAAKASDGSARSRAWSLAQAGSLMMALALVYQPNGAVAPSGAIEPLLWKVLMIALAAVAVWCAILARVELQRELRWLTRRLSEKAPPVEHPITLAMLPSLALAPVAGWASWTLAFSLGLGGAALAVAVRRSDRDRPSPKPADPKPELTARAA
jgi:hypothetical protein